MEVGQVGIASVALPQSYVSPKTTYEELVVRNYLDSNSSLVINLLYKLFSCTQIFI